MELELSNYWDDFKERVNETIDCLQKGELPGLERLTVHLTEQCNFRCDYCNMRFSKRTMEKELAKKIIDEYAANGVGKPFTLLEENRQLCHILRKFFIMQNVRD